MPSFEERVNLAKQKKIIEEIEKRKLQPKASPALLNSEALGPVDQEIRRIEAVRNSPEWQQMFELSKSKDFLLALRLYWEKFADRGVDQLPISGSYHEQSFLNVVTIGLLGQDYHPLDWRNKTFEEALEISEHPELTKLKQKGRYDSISTSHGIINFTFKVGQIWHEGSHENDVSGWDPVFVEFLIFWQDQKLIVEEFIDEPFGGLGMTNIGLRKPKIYPGYEVPQGLVIAAENNFFTPEQFWDYMAMKLA